LRLRRFLGTELVIPLVFSGELVLAKNQNTYEKRRREFEKRRKQAEKLARRQERQKDENTIPQTDIPLEEVNDQSV
jgi:23S rRNA-/tRNA-specific pseudouridylate synthase